MDVGISRRAELKQKISLNQLRSLEMLAMDGSELNELLKSEYLENPLLDCSELHHPERRYDTRDRSYGKPVTYETGLKDIFDDELNRDIPEKKSRQLREFILEQLPLDALDDRQVELFRYLTDCLEDTGYFTMSVKEAAKLACVSEEEVRKALSFLRELEPYGIFAEDLRSCLLMQLKKSRRDKGLLWDITDRYLQEVAEGNIGKISRGLKVSTAEVRKAIEELVKLEPKPAAGFGANDTSYIIPDIIFSRENGQWTIELNDKWTEDYSLNDYYVSILRDTEDPELRAYFEKKLERARLIIANIKQRRKTLLAVSGEILEGQKAFFESSGPLRPLSMQDVAERLNISTSTVSRAVKGKYIEHPAGITEARSLFVGSAAPAGDSETSVTAEQVKKMIAELVEKEDKKKPLSDQRLSELINETGIAISRRTVAKYREESGIKKSFERKEP